MTEQVIITLVVPPRLEDACIERLLEHPSTPAFSSSPGRGHGEHTEHLSLAEQVSGWRREVRIEVLVAASDRIALLSDLREHLPTEAIRYTVTPVLEAGDFSGNFSGDFSGDVSGDFSGSSSRGSSGNSGNPSDAKPQRPTD